MLWQGLKRDVYQMTFSCADDRICNAEQIRVKQVLLFTFYELKDTEFLIRLSKGTQSLFTVSKCESTAAS